MTREWLGSKKWEAATKKHRTRTLERLAFSQIGALPVADVVPAQILSLLRKIESENGSAVAQVW